jgi:gas vesicle protein
MSSAKVLLSALAGVAIGIQIGVLIAPDKGEETRKKLSKKGDDYLDEINSQFHKFIDGITEKLDKVNKKVAHISEEGKNKVGDLNKEVASNIK